MKKIAVKILAKKNYEIEFFENFENLQKKILAQIGARKFAILTDENIFQKTGFFTKNFAEKKIGEKILVLPAGEKEKNLVTIQKIWDFLFAQKFDRGSILVAIGGGVVGDTAGFAAATFKRGINFLQIPTTFLAAADASVGGKTGFDTKFGKNTIGTFFQPEKVFCCAEFFKNLPKTEIQNGICEMIKHGILADEKHFSDLEKIAKKYFLQKKFDEKILAEIFAILPDSISIKKFFVENDERENGIRAHLNFGHTFGHAIELLSNYEIPHGRAVAIGIFLATKFAIEKNFCDEKILPRIEKIFQNFEIDLKNPFSEKEIWEKMAHDKKVLAGKIRLILPKKIGEVFIFSVEK